MVVYSGKQLCRKELSSVLCDYLEGWLGGGREAQEGGICVYIRLIHAIGWQTLTQHCKAIILQLKTGGLGCFVHPADVSMS